MSTKIQGGRKNFELIAEILGKASPLSYKTFNFEVAIDLVELPHIFENNYVLI